MEKGSPKMKEGHWRYEFKWQVGRRKDEFKLVLSNGESNFKVIEVGSQPLGVE